MGKKKETFFLELITANFAAIKDKQANIHHTGSSHRILHFPEREREERFQTDMIL